MRERMWSSCTDFGDADRHRLHVAPGQAAVGVQPLVDDDQVAQLLEQSVVVHGQPAADVDQVVLLGAHPGAVGVGAELEQNLGDRLAGVARLALLDEERVLHHARGVEEDPDAVPVAQLAQRACTFAMLTGWPPAMFTVPARLT